jgi:hypothetical protein
MSQRPKYTDEEMDELERKQDEIHRCRQIIAAVNEYDVVQIRPGVHPQYSGAFALVDEVRGSHLVVNVPEMSRSNTCGACAWSKKIYLGADDFDVIGRCRWLYLLKGSGEEAWRSPEEWEAGDD